MLKLYTRVKTNATTGGTNTVTVRKNEAATALTMTIGTGATGEFENTVAQISVASGDYLSIEYVTGTGGGIDYTFTSVIFDAGAKTVTVLQSGDVTTATTASLSRYNNLSASSSNAISTESTCQYTARLVGTLKNMAVSTTTNGRTTDTLVKSRKDTADGALLVTVTATDDNVIKEDTANSDSIVAGSLTNWMYTVGTGSGTCNFEYVKFELETTNNLFLFMIGAGTLSTFNPATTIYLRVGGNVSSNDTIESDVQMLTRLNMTVASLGVIIATNTINSGTSTVTVRKNAVDTSIVVSIGFGATGTFEDTTNIATFGELDQINYAIVISGTTGTLQPSQVACVAQEIPLQPMIDNQTTQSNINIVRTKTMRAMPVWC